MKTFFITIMTLMVLFFSVKSSTWDDGEYSPQYHPTGDAVRLHTTGGTPSRPDYRIPTYIDCVVEESGSIVFDLPTEIETLEVSIYKSKSNGQTPLYMDEVTGHKPSLNVSLPSGRYIIECITEEGITYSGVISLRKDSI